MGVGGLGGWLRGTGWGFFGGGTRNFYFNLFSHLQPFRPGSLLSHTALFTLNPLHRPTAILRFFTLLGSLKPILQPQKGNNGTGFSRKPGEVAGKVDCGKQKNRFCFQLEAVQSNIITAANFNFNFLIFPIYSDR